MVVVTTALVFTFFNHFNGLSSLNKTTFTLVPLLLKTEFIITEEDHCLLNYPPESIALGKAGWDMPHFLWLFPLHRAPLLNGVGVGTQNDNMTVNGRNKQKL